jgi:hypothetical protein
MAQAEIDSFILKFKNLLISGRNATLVIKSNAGKAEVSLNVELGQVLPPHVQHQHQRSRDGPSRQRRKLRRAEARAAVSKSEEALVRIDDEAQPAAHTTRASEKETDFVQTESETLKDEFCPDETFQKQVACTPEKESDAALVDKILITADCQADWNDAYVIKLVDEKLKAIGIKMKSIIVNRNIRKCFESCLVTIEPSRRTTIESETFPIRRWSMKCVP